MRRRSEDRCFCWRTGPIDSLEMGQKIAAPWWTLKYLGNGWSSPHRSSGKLFVALKNQHFTSKINYQWPLSIAILVDQRVYGMIDFDPSAHQPFEAFHGNCGTVIRCTSTLPLDQKSTPRRACEKSGGTWVLPENMAPEHPSVYIYIHTHVYLTHVPLHMISQMCFPQQHILKATTATTVALWLCGFVAAENSPCPKESIHAIKTEFNQRVPR